MGLWAHGCWFLGALDKWAHRFLGLSALDPLGPRANGPFGHFAVGRMGPCFSGPAHGPAHGPVTVKISKTLNYASLFGHQASQNQEVMY